MQYTAIITVYDSVVGLAYIYATISKCCVAQETRGPLACNPVGWSEVLLKSPPANCTRSQLVPLLCTCRRAHAIPGRVSSRSAYISMHRYHMVITLLGCIWSCFATPIAAIHISSKPSFLFCRQIRPAGIGRDRLHRWKSCRDWLYIHWYLQLASIYICIYAIA